MTPLARIFLGVLGLTLLCGSSQAADTQNLDTPRLVVQTGHLGKIFAVAYSPDGRTIASGGGDSTVKLWDAASGQELRTLTGHTSLIQSVKFSPDGKMLASGSADATVKLWDVANGRELRTLDGHAGGVSSVAFSPDGKTLASGSGDVILNVAALKLWEVASGRELRTFAGPSFVNVISVESVAFSPDGKTLASGTARAAITLWDVASGRQLRTLDGHSGAVRSVAFSPDGKILASGSADDTVKLWDLRSGRELRALGAPLPINSIAFSPDGKTLASAEGQFMRGEALRLWDVASGTELRAFSGHTSSVNSVAFAPNGKSLASASNDSTVKLWDPASGHELRTLAGHAWGGLNSAVFSPDGRTLAWADHELIKLCDLAGGGGMRALAGHSAEIRDLAFSADGKALVSADRPLGREALVTLKVWEVANGQELRSIADPKGSTTSALFSSNGKSLVSKDGDGTFTLWDSSSGRKMRALGAHLNDKSVVAFSADGKTAATSTDDGIVKLWDMASGQELHTLAMASAHVELLAFSPDGKTLVAQSVVAPYQPGDVQLWEVASGIELHKLHVSSRYTVDVAFSRDSNTLATWTWFDQYSVMLWDVASGQLLHALSAQSVRNDEIASVDFSPDGKVLALGSTDNTVKLWDVTRNVQLATITSFNDDSWAITDSAGRYDASNAGNNHNLHWVVGMTPIALDQLKDRYYEPGLLAKIMGHDPEPLRTVPSLQDALAHLFPEVRAQLDAAHPLQIIVTLRDQGGGYGKVRVRLNGKEITPDARNRRRLKNATEVLSVRVSADSLQAADNSLDVVAWNADGNLSSPPAIVKLEGARGAKPVADAQASMGPPPTLHAIVVGVAHFRDPGMTLSFSGKDAHDFAEAITLGADRLFGADKVRLHLLSDYQDQSAAGTLVMNTQAPSRDNLQSAFAQVAKEAMPGDILVVFLAGHGVMSGGADGDYYYLTNDAAGLDLADPAVRKLWGVSSAELTEWIKQIRANKQMMVLDTCASGGALQKLTAKRAVPSSQIIALDRLKDRTGFYVLAGAAADRVSYETTRFGQGLLTRALLTGIKGAALRDGEFVDVANLFQYARDQVPKLAQEIGGIQAPLVAAPGGDSFDIGQMLEADQRAVPLAAVREMMVQSNFQDEERMADVVRLSTRFNQRLRAENAVAVRGQLAFVDADHFPDAWRLAGRYRQTPQGLQVTARLFQNTDPKGTLQLTLTGDQNEQVEQLFAAVMQRISRSDH